MTKLPSGVREFREILNLLRQRKSYPRPIRAIQDRKVFTILPQNSGHGESCGIYSLSPSDEQVEKFLKEIADLKPCAGESKRHIPKPKRDHLATALWIELGRTAVLLGSDLETVPGNSSGWSAVVASLNKPSGRAGIFKIPHHGSITAHHDGVWNQMLSTNSSAILTPFVKGSTKLPTQENVIRILNKINSAYSASLIIGREKKDVPLRSKR